MTPGDSQQVQQVICQFIGDDGAWAVRELGAGNINITLLVTTGRRSIILQRINRQVFPDPIAVAENFALVSRHLARRQRQQGGGYRFATLLPTREGRSWCRDDSGEVWRAQSYLPGQPLAEIDCGEQAREIGLALGRFHHLIGDLAVDSLREPLPGFHILPRYLEEFDRLADRIEMIRDADLQKCLTVIERYRDLAPVLQRACEQGILPRRPIHGDPKVDNFLFDTGQARALSLIDLDTVGPGLLHYDLGDCLRSCCNRGGEGGNPLHVRFDLDICRNFLSGYNLEMGGSLTRADREYIYEAVLVISYELGLRFLTDHLRGDTYFKVRRKGENLRRALVQFTLVERIAEQEDSLRTLTGVTA